MSRTRRGIRGAGAWFHRGRDLSLGGLGDRREGPQGCWNPDIGVQRDSRWGSSSWPEAWPLRDTGRRVRAPPPLRCPPWHALLRPPPRSPHPLRPRASRFRRGRSPWSRPLPKAPCSPTGSSSRRSLSIPCGASRPGEEPIGTVITCSGVWGRSTIAGPRRVGVATRGPSSPRTPRAGTARTSPPGHRVVPTSIASPGAGAPGGSGRWESRLAAPAGTRWATRMARRRPGRAAEPTVEPRDRRWGVRLVRAGPSGPWGSARRPPVEGSPPSGVDRDLSGTSGRPASAPL